MSSNEQEKPVTTEPVVGIDLGTTNSLVAFCDEAGPRILRPEAYSAEKLVPSVVRFSKDGSDVEAVGTDARRHAVEHPGQTVFSVKRLMGRGIKDVEAELEHLPYKVIAGEHDTARVAIADSVISPQEVSAIILGELRKRAEAALGKPVSKAVITVPAYFDDAQRQATRDAGRIAGLDVVRMVNEPTAAALAYNLGARQESKKPTHGKPSGLGGLRIGLGKCESDEEQPNAEGDSEHEDAVVAVFDLGGGTFDVSILRMTQTDQGAVDQVLATAGDTHLGGDDVDQMIIQLIQNEIREQFGQSLDFPAATQQAFRNLAEAAKIRLSTETEAPIEIELPAADGQPRTYTRTITRDEFEAMIAPWVERALQSCSKAIKDAELAPDAIDRVIMVGGSTRIPLVRSKVEALFGKEPYTALDPDEVVALGAAVQASILMGVNRDMLLLDVIPLSLGIETMGGAVAKMVMANSTIPARATENFSTYVDGQTSVKIHVLQGEREMVEDCRSLGTFELKGVPPMPAGFPKVQVTFLVDANGILNVSAIEQRSGTTASIQVVPNHGLTRDEVKQMEEQSLAHAREDMNRHRMVDLKNQARLDMRAIDRQLQKVGSELPKEDRETIEAHMTTVRGYLNEDAPDLDAFGKALTEMDQSTVRLAELAIKQALQED